MVAVDEARTFGHRYVRPEHMVLGLLSQPEELAGRALAELDVSRETLRICWRSTAPAQSRSATSSLECCYSRRRSSPSASGKVGRLPHSGSRACRRREANIAGVADEAYG
jgi:ATP-dependent Clp protease ATP-binding subunit ClpA